MAKSESESDLIFFKETFKLLNVDPRKFTYRLKTHPFDQSQKKLLQAFVHFKKNNKEETFALLKGYKLENFFLEGVRLYLLGMAHNHFGAFAFAVEHLTKSVDIFQSIDEEDFAVYTLSILVLALGNQRNLKEMAGYVDKMKSCHPSTDHCRLLMIHAEVVYLVLSDHLPKATTILKKTLSGSLQNLELFKPSFLILYFGIVFKNKNYSHCGQILEEYKTTTGFTVKINYLYMKSLLDHIAAKKPLYIYANDFKDFPELHHQLEVVKSLAKGDLTEAGKFWTLLSKHNPALYTSDFKYMGDYSLFSCALDLYTNFLKAHDLDMDHLQKCKTALEKLHYIFSSVHAPISKAELIRLIWNEEVSELGLSRLRGLVFQFKKKFGMSVVSHQETYRLEKAPQLRSTS